MRWINWKKAGTLKEQVDVNQKFQDMFYISVGYLGFLLIGLAVMRYIVVLHDAAGQILTFLGFVMIIIYSRFIERKAGISKNMFVMSKVLLTIALITLTIWFFLL